MRQATLPVGILAPGDVLVCRIDDDLEAELRTLLARQPPPAREAPRGVWLVKRECFSCAVSPGYCRRHRG